MKNCIFCKIIKREVPTEIIYENEHVISFYGLTSIADVHVLVVLKKHIENIIDIKEEDDIIITEMRYVNK